METYPSERQTSNAVQVIRLVRRRIGDRINAASYVQHGPTCVGALDMAQYLLRRHATPEAAADHLAGAITRGEIRIVPRPTTQWTRAQKLAYAAQRRGPTPRDTAMAALDELGRGKRILANVHGASRAAPVRDAHGRIDILATAQRHGLLVTAKDADEQQAARFAAGDLASHLAFG